MMNEGIRLLKRGQYDRALAHLWGQKVDSDEYPELSYYLGLCYTHLEKYDDRPYVFEVLPATAGTRFSFSASASAVNVTSAAGEPLRKSSDGTYSCEQPARVSIQFTKKSKIVLRAAHPILYFALKQQ